MPRSRPISLPVQAHPMLSSPVAVTTAAISSPDPAAWSGYVPVGRLQVALFVLVSMFWLAGGAVAQEADRDKGDSATQGLVALVDEEWQWRLGEFPTLATRTGVRGSDHLMPEVSLAAEARRARAQKGFLDRLEKIDREALNAADQVTYDVFAWELREAVAGHGVGLHYFPINADSGFHTGVAWLPQTAPLATVEDYESYIARLRALPEFFEGNTSLLKAGMEKGFVQPKVVLEGYEGTISAHVVEKVEESVFYAPFANIPAFFSDEDRSRLEAEGRAAVMQGPVEAYSQFLTFFTEVYRPGALDEVGASAFEGGAELYANRVRHYTTLDVDAEQVHRIGLAEVARIRAEMETIIADVGFEGSFADFLAFLRTDPRFYATTPEEIMKQASYLAKKMDGQLPKLFGKLPRQPYGVEPVPDYLAPKYTAGRYVPAPLDSKRGGTYWVNTYALDKRPLYALEALTLHEAVPGHHLQGALSKELDLPQFRRQLYISAFGEGWGLYSERLGLEAGFYTDPYSNFGRLTYEMWRACRLVVDTGLHAKGWTRQQALDYLAGNTALSLHEVETEIDRYISWPGQALAYKMGEIEIRRLRARAEEALGGRFDLREFHDRLLANGALPLPILAAQVDAWIGEVDAR